MRRAALLFAVLTLAGCGTHRSRPPDVLDPAAPRGTVAKSADGISYRGPRNWQPLARAGSLVGGLVSNTATVAIWRYPRTEPLPADRAALEQARTLLLDSVRQRNPSFSLDAARTTRIGGAPGIEITGAQTVAGSGYSVRSMHLFAHGAEIVVDAYAPAHDFARVDRQVFRPLLKSLRVTKR